MILYKYLHPDRRQPIEENTFRFTQPNACNDPFECSPRMVIAKTIDDAKEQFHRMEQKYRGEFLPPGATTATKEKWLASVMKDDQHCSDDLRLLKKLQDIHSQKMGILCLTKNPKKLSMWSHYSCDHTGFVVGIDSEHDWFSDPAPGKFVGTIKDVVYGSQRPEMTGAGMNDNLDDLSYLYHKGSDWEYEDECRYILPLSLCDEACTGVFVRKFPLELIKTVIFGYRISPDVEESIRETLVESTVEYLRTEPSSVTYDMELTKA